MYVEIARASSTRGDLVLRTRSQDAGPAILELRANGVFVMDTWEVSTEQALATEVMTLVDHPGRVLVGGLGLGYTLDEVLRDPRVETCTVVEIEEALVRWMRDGTVPHGPGVLQDDRIDIRVDDIASAVIGADDAAYDLVLLDVDNGPGYLVHETNAGLYAAPFLHQVRRVLAGGGVLSVWSADVAPDLADALSEVFGSVEARALPVRLQGRAEEYWLYLARA